MTGIRQICNLKFAICDREDEDLVAAREEIYGVQVLRSSLEDAYLEAVGEA